MVSKQDTFEWHVENTGSSRKVGRRAHCSATISYDWDLLSLLSDDGFRSMPPPTALKLIWQEREVIHYDRTRPDFRGLYRPGVQTVDVDNGLTMAGIHAIAIDFLKESNRKPLQDFTNCLKWNSDRKLADFIVMQCALAWMDAQLEYKPWTPMFLRRQETAAAISRTADFFINEVRTWRADFGAQPKQLARAPCQTT